jgi:hypothetical protein
VPPSLWYSMIAVQTDYDTYLYTTDKLTWLNKKCTCYYSFLDRNLYPEQNGLSLSRAYHLVQLCMKALKKRSQQKNVVGPDQGVLNKLASKLELRLGLHRSRFQGWRRDTGVSPSLLPCPLLFHSFSNSWRDLLNVTFQILLVVFWILYSDTDAER